MNIIYYLRANNNNNLLLIIKLTIKTYLQLISLKKKKYIFSQSTIYTSFQFINSCSFRFKKIISIKKKKIHFN